MFKAIILNAIYKHYTGKHYKVLNIARNESNPNQIMVVYQAQHPDELEKKLFDGKTIWVRPIEDFLGFLDNGKPRFSYVKNGYSSSALLIDTFDEVEK